MSLTEHPNLEQGSEEWLAVRRGMVTASAVGQLITPTLKVASNDASRALTATLVAERITGWTEHVFVNGDMLRGTMDEPYARAAYSKHNDVEVRETGFMVRDDWGFDIGFSPDGLVGDDGLIEIKSRRPKKHLQTILSDQVPAENMAQLQAGLLVSGRKWIDYVSFCGGMPLYVKRVLPDLVWQAVIVTAVKDFEGTANQMSHTYRVVTKDLPLTERIDHFAEVTF